MRDAVINVNGKILEPGEAFISVYDRGYLYGDSLYEVARTYDGKFFRLEEHLNRLEQSAVLCRMILGQGRERYREEILKTFEVFRKKAGGPTEAYVRLIVTRGVGTVGFGLTNLMTPTQFVVMVRPLEVPSPEHFARGARLQLAAARMRNDHRALDPAMKSGNYLNSLLAFLEAQTVGCDDAVLCNSEGHVAEGTTFNVFYARRGIIATPPLDIGILDGITRREVIGLARSLGIEVREVRFPRERLLEADEVFMTSSLKEVFPVTYLDENRVGTGKPGPITLRLRDAFQARVAGRSLK